MIKQTNFPVCSDCAFFEDFGGGRREGLCRRQSPKLVAAIESSEGQWPEVAYTDYCGEFRHETTGVRFVETHIHAHRDTAIENDGFNGE